MLVDVVELRLRGEKRPLSEVEAAKPVRGWLQLDLANVLWRSNRNNPRLLALLLNVERNQQLLEPLDYARVRKIERGTMLIVGMQRHVRPIRVYEDLPQAWWVRPLGPSSE